MRYQWRPDLTRSIARSRSGNWARADLQSFVARGLIVALFFAGAFAIDRLTGQRYSSMLGSVAITGSVVSLFPAVRPALVALGGYGATWLGFNLVRAVADDADAGLGVGHQDLAASVEGAMFGGGLPSAWLQETFHEPGQVHALDLALALVHASFFVAPFAVAAVLWWTRRAAFAQYCQATAIAFGLGLVGFVALPTAPPWLSSPETVERIAIHALALGSSGRDPALAFEPNHVAALPSVHVAAAVLVYLASRAGRFGWRVAGAAYAAVMSLAVVYLGEHYLLDVLLGWTIALAGWRLARWRPVP